MRNAEVDQTLTIASAKPGSQPLPDAAKDSAFVVLGKVWGAWGIKGWVKIQPFADDPLSWKTIRRLSFVMPSAGAEMQEADLVELRLHGDGLVAKFAGTDDRSAAESLAGRLVGTSRDGLPETSDGEYYWGDLIGLHVRNPAGVEFGSVVKLLETGASAVLVVEGQEGVERLIPFVAQAVLSVDLAAREIVVDWELDW